MGVGRGEQGVAIGLVRERRGVCMQVRGIHASSGGRAGCARPHASVLRRCCRSEVGAVSAALGEKSD